MGGHGWLLLSFLFVIGACVGSFLNVVAWRLPRACMSVVRPGSRCPRCRRALPWHENLPVIGWLLLSGRCRGCKGSISFRYPAVELVTGILFALMAWVFLPEAAFDQPRDHGGLWLSLGVFLLIASALMALSLIDFDFRILPDAITWPGIVLGPILAFLAPQGQHGRYAFALFADTSMGLRLNAGVNGILFAAPSAGLLYGFGWPGSKAFGKPAMGLGDVKMIGAMGAFQGSWALLALVVASVLGALIGIAARLLTRSRYIPFGPFLALGMLTVMLWGPEILSAYLRLFQHQ